ncbi:MAG TPA: succinate dehydrogenase, hydrophobic membrane anchor protein [Acetobacteraceae bacterium]|jgi:succinate dehydrogenase / fumarate reductase membrane anchor subunit|nr:succinate dehydrogenase, hydrophobic membrane anchor protein [Acetobacteraceae bacterium]
MSETNKTVQVRVMRSQLGQVRGLGSAKSGAAHWWAQRLTAVALVPLTLWFVWSALHLVGASHDAMLAWIGGPIPVVLLIALVLATFYHLALGMQIVIEDYVSSELPRLITLLAIKGVIILLALTCLISILKLGL